MLSIIAVAAVISFFFGSLYTTNTMNLQQSDNTFRLVDSCEDAVISCNHSIYMMQAEILDLQGEAYAKDAQLKAKDLRLRDEDLKATSKQRHMLFCIIILVLLIYGCFNLTLDKYIKFKRETTLRKTVKKTKITKMLEDGPSKDGKE